MFERFSRRSIAATGAALLATLGVSGVAVAASGSTAAQSNERPGVESNAPENSAKDPDNVQYTAPGDANAKSAAKRASATKSASAAKPSAKEAPGTEQSAASEQSGAEQPGNETPANSDGPGGHADEPGNANADHQFQGQE